ncbi:hypothetical protein CLV59_109142 [Chitinophaga dinghuensis]|uniref:Uncharacterized protein n=1 Tax=Chitinophaga dinghuensis TaxID=1539050 RepID=A0A327VPQ5_9BACT|nr:hypothetical protein CLV59_109142 [Chitinophaga dinghuensis]
MFVSSILIVLLLFRSCKQQARIALLEMNLTDTPIVKHYQDKSGLQHTVAPVMPVVKGYAAVKQVISKTAVSEKQVQYITAASVITRDTVYISKAVKTNDTLQFDYDDKWISIHGKWNDSLILSYAMRDSIWFVNYWKKKGLFRREEFMDGFSANPHTSISGLTAISTGSHQRKPMRISIGPSLGYHYAGGKFSWSVGVGIQYNIIRF